MWWVAALMVVCGLAVAIDLAIGRRRAPEPVLPAASVCAQCGTPSGEPAYTVPGGWALLTCEKHQLVELVCSDPCLNTRIRRHIEHEGA